MSDLRKLLDIVQENSDDGEPQIGDFVSIEMGDTLLETYIEDITEDGVIVKVDETAIQLMINARKQLIENDMGQGNVLDRQLKDIDPEDHEEGEGSFVKNQIHTMLRVLTHLENAIGDDEDLPEWVGMKISQAQSMIVGVMDFMVSDKEREMERMSGDEILMREDDLGEEKKGLWANIHAKRERIKHGSGEKMRKPGSKGAPSAQDFRDAAKEGYEGALTEFAPDGFNDGDDGEKFNPRLAKMAFDDGRVKGVSLANGATLEHAMAIDEWDHHDGGIYKQYFADGFKKGRLEKIAFNNKKHNLNLKLMKDGSIRHGEQGVAEGEMDEAKYQGREVPLGKPMAGDVKKSKVYVKKPNGKVVKVNFGDKNMRIKKSNPNRRKSFRARHNCENPGPRWKARYWSCRAW